jgi:hypothetical protein
MVTVRVVPKVQLMSCGQLPQGSCRQQSLDGPERTSGRRTAPGFTPSIITSPDDCPSTEIRLGVLARTPTVHQLQEATTPS